MTLSSFECVTLKQAAATQVPTQDELLQAARQLAELSQAKVPQDEIDLKSNELATSSAAAARNTVFSDINDGSFKGYTLSTNGQLEDAAAASSPSSAAGAGADAAKPDDVSYTGIKGRSLAVASSGVLEVALPVKSPEGWMDYLMMLPEFQLVRGNFGSTTLLERVA
eukprot:gene7351-7562_t